ncbi:TPA: hypothetical protein ENS27_04450 [bacterium]|nr:hypothetical protein [bacterium]
MKKGQKKTIEPDNERREFIKKSTKMVGAYGFALYELAEELKNSMDDIVHGFVEDIKKEVKKP